jgi:hypothetical protein
MPVKSHKHIERYKIIAAEKILKLFPSRHFIRILYPPQGILFLKKYDHEKKGIPIRLFE